MSKSSELLEPDDAYGPISRDELITLWRSTRKQLDGVLRANADLAEKYAELLEWKLGMKGVEEFYAMREHARTLEGQRDSAVTDLEAVKTATCDWTENEAHGGWEAACGLAWQFTTGTPESNGLWHCPRCGRKVVAPDACGANERRGTNAGLGRN
jgi:hypothetical protein